MTGLQFEKLMAEELSAMGYWVLRVSPAPDGSQPADLVAVRYDVPFLIDCKVLAKNTKGKFPLSRIEENQKLASEHWERCGNRKCNYLLAIYYDGKIHLVSMEDISNLKANVKHFDVSGCEASWAVKKK